MSGAVYARTPNLGLGLIEFDFPNWADDANLNTKILDSGFALVGISIKGSWQNNTPYIAGDLVVDVDQNTLWRAQIAHTSAATGTFAEDRLANPTFWVDATNAIHSRGQWTPSTQYYTNDIVYNDTTKQIWAIATKQFVSGTVFQDDIDAGNFVIITDLTEPVGDANAAASAADASADLAASHSSTAQAAAGAASSSATSAAGSATVAVNSANAAATSETNAASSAASATASAASADASEADAELAAANALALFNAMMPDAPSDSKQYARKNGAWDQVKTSATPQDTAPSSPEIGQLWYETDTGNLYIWFDDGTSSQWVQVNVTGGGGGSGAATAVQDSAPSTPVNGQLWWESDTGILWMWYDDGDTTQWVQVNGAAGGSVTSPPMIFPKADMTIADYDNGIGIDCANPLNYFYLDDEARWFNQYFNLDGGYWMNAPAGKAMSVWGSRGADIARWQLCLGNTVAEGGSNTGSNFQLGRYNDAGTFIDNPLFIRRDDGILQLAKGLKLNALSTDPNTLDAYEENSWVPSLQFGGAAVGMTYGGIRTGRYTKIGRLVFASFDFQLTAKGTSTGVATITGFPYANETGVLGIMPVVYHSAMSGVVSPVSGYMSNGTLAALVEGGTAAVASLTDTKFTATTRLIGMAIYNV